MILQLLKKRERKKKEKKERKRNKKKNKKMTIACCVSTQHRGKVDQNEITFLC
jgi:hypothetical protein